jgi:hypothetical protein
MRNSLSKLHLRAGGIGLSLLVAAGAAVVITVLSL